jgi:hypothetical protein
MTAPGFTAEASVGPMTQIYRMHDRCGTIGGRHVYVQSDGAAWGEDYEDYGESIAMAEEDGESMDMAEDDAVDMNIQEELEMDDDGEAT